MGILEGKRILVAGVTMESSFGFHVARLAQEEGATVVISNFGRALNITKRIAARLPVEPPIIELDVTDQEHLDRLADELRQHVDGLDGLVHSIAFAPQGALGGAFLETSFDDVATAMHVSTYSFKSLTVAALPLLVDGASVVGLDFDAQVAWPGYDWMGVAKAGEEAVTRYLAKYLGPRGIRVNMISAGPVRTMAARSIPGFDRFEGVWNDRAPLGWDLSDSEPGARGVVALLSDWFPKTTGEIIHVDGGVHAVGA
jgi:meromycolic acid enoyl-[acyl-carrier-protein] reductase